MVRKTALFSSVLVLLVTLSAVPVFAGPKGPTIVEVAVAVNSAGPFAGQFDVLIDLVSSSPAVLETLNGNGQYTVFAPTDAAFEALLADFPGLDLTPELIEQVLLYHVAHGRRYAADVVASDRIRTLNKMFLMQDGGELTDNQGRTATIIFTDVEAANGIIHVIDAVVLP